MILQEVSSSGANTQLKLGIVRGLARDCRRLRTALAAYRGLVGVGYGQRERNGELLDDVAIRIYVASERESTELRREAFFVNFQATYPSINLDVIVHVGAGMPCTSRPTLYPGDEIAPDIDTDSNESHGTLGLIVTKDNGGHTARYLLTNAHVLNRGIASTSQNLYKPHKTTCNKPAATIPLVPQPDQPPYPKNIVHTQFYADSNFPGLSFKVDAGLASINSDIKSSNINPHITEKIPQFGPSLRNIVKEFSIQPVSSVAEAKTLNAAIASKNIKVKKFGATTGFTRGLIVGVCVPSQQPSSTDPSFTYELIIAPDPEEPVKTTVFTVSAKEVAELSSSFDPQTQFVQPSVTLTPGPVSGEDQKITLSGRIFSDSGDSGAVILDETGNIVGLFQETMSVITRDNQFLNQGIGFAQFIVTAFDALGLSPNAVVAPGAPQSGMAVNTIEPATESSEQGLIDAAERLFGGTAVGARLIGLARTHLAEVQRVLHHRRRGVVAWHRNKGPAYVAAISRATRSVGRAVPTEIDGVRIGDALRGIRRVLAVEGSPALRRSLDEHGDWLIETLERATDPEEAFHMLLAEEDGAPAAAPTYLRVVNNKGKPGTVGALVRCEDGVMRCLTNHHVLFGNGGAAGEIIFAVGELSGRQHLVPIGTTTRGYIGRVMHSGVPTFVDCALATLSDPASWPASLKQQLSALPILREISDPAIGDVVMKCGSATGRTTGRIVDIAYPDRPFIDGQQYDAPGQVLVKPLSAAGVSSDVEINFCAGGDSGAVVVDAEGRATGLLWGSNANGEGIACPIRAVLSALGVESTDAPAAPNSLNLVES